MVKGGTVIVLMTKVIQAAMQAFSLESCIQPILEL